MKATEMSEICRDLRPEQRYVIEKLGDDYAIRDRQANPEFDYDYAVQGIETREEAQMLLNKMVRGESLMDV